MFVLTFCAFTSFVDEKTVCYTRIGLTVMTILYLKYKYDVIVNQWAECRYWSILIPKAFNTTPWTHTEIFQSKVEHVTVYWHLIDSAHLVKNKQIIYWIPISLLDWIQYLFFEHYFCQHDFNQLGIVLYAEI